MTKKQLIDKIKSYHPASEAGRKRGWSEYTGGMKDSGSWDSYKLFTATVAELKQCLSELIEEHKPVPPRVLTPEEEIQSKNIVKFEGGFASELFLNDMSKFFTDMETKLFLGHKKRT